MPLGEGYSAEEQITGQAEHGGLQLQVYPLKAAIYFETSIKTEFPRRLADILPSLLPIPEPSPQRIIAKASVKTCALGDFDGLEAQTRPDLGLGAGGKMRQEIYQDDRSLEDYDQSLTSRCFVHLCNSSSWKTITGSNPPRTLITAELYSKLGLPWFDYYRDDLSAVEGSKELASIKTVADLFDDIEPVGFPDNESVEPKRLIQYGRRRRPKEVMEWTDEDTTL